MIKIFGQNDTSFITNGDVVLRPLKAKVTKKDNGDYYLDLECGLEYVDYFTEGRIVTANTPTGDQAFRIGNVTKSKYKLVAKCYHVFYDSRNYLIADSLVESRDCDYAIKHFNSATEPQSEYTVSSDVATIESFRCVRKSFYECIQTLIEKWGGHLVRDNFNIQIKANIGQDNGITIQYKKNLKDISVQENWNNVVTKILPVGKDGILLNALNPSASIYITSETQYALPYTKTITFQQNLEQKDFPSETAYQQALINDLRTQATAYLNKNCVPQVNYTLKANLDRVTDIGDTIEVIDDRLGVNMMTHVIGFVYDCIFEKYTEVQFGNFANTLSGFANSINQTVDTKVAESVQASSDAIEAVLNGSYVVMDGEKLLILDQLPKADAVNVLKIANNGLSRSTGGADGTFNSIMSMTGVTNLDNLTIQKGGNTLTDFVRSEGITDGWTWRKYTSGKVEAWKTVTIDSTQLTWSAFTTLQTAEADIDYPFTINNAILLATMESCPDIGWIASATDGSIRIIREGTSGNMTVNIFIKGEI